MVVFDAWYLAEDVVRVLAQRRKDWTNPLKTDRLLETASVYLQDANGWTLKLPAPLRGRALGAVDPQPRPIVLSP
jgi:hypothetical protein